MPTNLVLFSRSGKNPELVYALRSWEANIVGKKHLTIVGDLPPGITPDNFIKGNPYNYNTVRDKQLNVYENWKRFCSSSEAPTKAIFMNDDFFLMCKARTVTLNPRNLNLKELHDFAINKFRRETLYSRTILATHEALVAEGIESPLSFDLHRPMPFIPSEMLEVLDRFKEPGLSRRSLYGNLTTLPLSEPLLDSKYTHGLNPPASDWISTDDKSFGSLEFFFESLWPTKSKWEEQ